jgi:benzoylformate decarboxylase
MTQTSCLQPLEKIESRRGADVLVDVLRSEGVRYVFGNPGATELSFIDALTDASDIGYMLGLQEAVVVGMADGYAQASGRPGFVNLHTVGGLGHAMGALLNAQIAKTPLVVTAGQQDTRHAFTDPLLSGNLMAVAGPVVKWAHEVLHPEQIPVLVRRAFHDSAAAPSGPVFLSLPMDVMERETTVDIARVSRIEHTAVAGSLDDLGEALCAIKPGRLALIAGDEVFRTNASQETVALAEAFGAPVFGSSWPAHIPYPTSHALWAGNLPTKASDIRAQLQSFDAVFALGGNFAVTILYSEGSALPPDCQLFQLTADARELGRTHATALSCVGDIKASLKSLLPMLHAKLASRGKVTSALRANAEGTRARQRASLSKQVLAETDSPTTTPLVAAAEVMRAIGPQTAIVDEAPVTMSLVRPFLNSQSSRQYYCTRGAILGWGMSAAVGVSLGLDREPVVALIGDGSALYAPQALWTAAREGLPVTFVVMNNCEYNILKNFMKGQTHFVSSKADRFIGMDLDHPPINFLALATAMGVRYRRVPRAADIAGAVQAGILSGLPNLIELPISAR